MVSLELPGNFPSEVRRPETDEMPGSLTYLAALAQAWPQAQMEEVRRVPWIAFAASSTRKASQRKVPRTDSWMGMQAQPWTYSRALQPDPTDHQATNSALSHPKQRTKVQQDWRLLRKHRRNSGETAKGQVA